MTQKMATKTEDEVLELSQDELDLMIQERAQEQVEAALKAAREEDDARYASILASQEDARAEAHELRVREHVQTLTAAGHAPAVLKVAEEIMLADQGKAVLTLSRDSEDGSEDVELSATDIVTQLLAAQPASALTKGQPQLRARKALSGGGSEETVEERAARLLNDMKTGPATQDV